MRSVPRTELFERIFDISASTRATASSSAASVSAEQADNQLDLLDAQARPDSDDAASHGEHA